MRVREKFGHYLVMIGKLGAKQRARDHLPLVRMPLRLCILTNNEAEEAAPAASTNSLGGKTFFFRLL